MSEYIRREDALEQFYDSISGVPVPSVEYVSEYAIKMTRRIQNLEPADVIPVVRCKDCLFFATEKSCCRPEGLIQAREDAFCSYGERKE